jgi:hypothetical protein
VNERNRRLLGWRGNKKCCVVISVRISGMGGEEKGSREVRADGGEKEIARSRTSENFSSHLSAGGFALGH